MKTELANLNAEKERLLAEYKTARTEAQEYETVKQKCGCTAGRSKGTGTTAAA
jgi:hypothetical protein